MAAKGDDGGEQAGSDEHESDHEAERSLTKKQSRAAANREDAVRILEKSDPEGPPQLSLVAATKRYGVAATGLVAGMVLSIGGLITVIVTETPEKFALAILLSIVIGGCAVGLATTSHLRTQRNVIDYLIRELERKSKENAKHVDRQMRNRQTSAPPSLSPAPAQPAPAPAPMKAHKKGDKKR